MATKSLSFKEKTNAMIEYSIFSDEDKIALYAFAKDIRRINIDNRDAWLKQADKDYQGNEDGIATCGRTFENLDEYLDYLDSIREDSEFDVDDPQCGRE